MAIPMFKPAIGGAEECVYQLAKRLVERNHEVTVLTSDVLKFSPQLVYAHRDSFTLDGVLIKRFHAVKFLGNYPLVPKCIPSLLHEKPDVVHGHVFGGFIPDAAAFVSAVRKVPFVFSPHGFLGMLSSHPLKQAYIAFSKIGTLRAAKRVICNSKADAEHYAKLTDPSKIVMIPNGVDVNSFASTGIHSFREDYRVDGPIVAAVGRITKEKGFQYLIRALPTVVQRIPTVKAVIAGEDFGFLSNLKCLAIEHGVDGNVIFARLSHEEIKGLLTDSCVVAIPSIYEGFPLVALEAMACGRPLVAANVGGLRDIISQNVNGILVHSGKPDELAQAIVTLIEDEKLSRQIGERNRQEVNKYSWDAIVDKTEALYHDLEQNPGNGNK